MPTNPIVSLQVLQYSINTNRDTVLRVLQRTIVRRHRQGQRHPQRDDSDAETTTKLVLLFIISIHVTQTRYQHYIGQQRQE